ncbi:NAD kinase [Aestuariivirga litoralis]|uniref:NAD kinase n=1 Tax=Aestuariivirga litoralis TaxID=2650924 RepID=UPI0018C69620|nr:NAD kinase [Aestuariivirga litoralis]MBG1231324.1 NAD kinase [Aestuariivirga litoralis]
MKFERIHFLASDAPQAQRALRRLAKRYGNAKADDADVTVALGGDGLMLQALHECLKSGLPVYGMNCGSVGFLMHDLVEPDLQDRLASAHETLIRPLAMIAKTPDGKKHERLAFNEVSLLRQRSQAAKLKLVIDGQVRLDEMSADGIILSTPVGSTAYNLSAHGPILPIGTPLLALTPLSVFRPRRWRGAILPDDSKVRIEVLEADKRPVAAVADHDEVRNIASVDIAVDTKRGVRMLFENGHGLAERVLNEQFKY